MSYRLRTLLIVVAAGPLLLYWFFAWLLFRPKPLVGAGSFLIYTEVTGISFGAAFVVAGVHAIRTKQMPLWGGGTATGDKAVELGWGAVVIGSLLMIGWAVALIVSLIR